METAIVIRYKAGGTVAGRLIRLMKGRSFMALTMTEKIFIAVQIAIGGCLFVSSWRIFVFTFFETKNAAISLLKYILQRSRLFIFFGSPIESMIAEIHAFGLIHGDGKPDTCILSTLRTHGLISGTLSTGIRYGDRFWVTSRARRTPIYSAPELVESFQAPHSSSVYSTAVLLSENFSEVTPYAAVARKTSNPS